MFIFFFQAEDGIRDLVRSRGLGDVYKRQAIGHAELGHLGGDGDELGVLPVHDRLVLANARAEVVLVVLVLILRHLDLSLIHISEPTRPY